MNEQHFSNPTWLYVTARYLSNAKWLYVWIGRHQCESRWTAFHCQNSPQYSYNMILMIMLTTRKWTNRKFPITITIRTETIHIVYNLVIVSEFSWEYSKICWERKHWEINDLAIGQLDSCKWQGEYKSYPLAHKLFTIRKINTFRCLQCANHFPWLICSHDLPRVDLS